MPRQIMWLGVILLILKGLQGSGVMKEFTQKLYWGDTYLFESGARVIDAGMDPEKGHWVELDQTIFHPQGGGQPSDEGTINGINVVRLEEQRVDEKELPAYDFGIIKHYLESSPNLSKGDEVKLCIDQNKRLHSAVLHTAGHVIAGVMRRDHGYVNQTGANHFPGQARVKFRQGGKALEKEKFEQECRSIVDQKLAISAEYTNVHEVYKTKGLGDRARVVSIAGLWTEPCSGTHTKTTAELGNITIRKIDSKKGEQSVGYLSQHSLFAQSTKPTSFEFVTPNGTRITFNCNGQSISTKIIPNDAGASDAIDVDISDIFINIDDKSEQSTKFQQYSLEWQLNALKELKEVVWVGGTMLAITQLNDWSFNTASQAQSSLVM